MDDRELLELAAKAARYRVHGWINGDLWVVDKQNAESQDPFIWNPRDDDNDALRLAGRLGLRISSSEEYQYTEVTWFPEFGHRRLSGGVVEKWGNDRDSAVRLSIVRAAAEIEKGKRNATGGFWKK